MKNQNDLIVLIGAFVVLIAAFCITYFTMPQVPKPTPPEPVTTSDAQRPTGVQPVMVNSLPGGGSGSGGGPSMSGGGGGKGPGGGPGGPGGGPGGPPAPPNKQHISPTAG